MYNIRKSIKIHEEHNKPFVSYGVEINGSAFSYNVLIPNATIEDVSEDENAKLAFIATMRKGSGVEIDPKDVVIVNE